MLMLLAWRHTKSVQSIELLDLLAGPKVRKSERERWKGHPADADDARVAAR